MATVVALNGVSIASPGYPDKDVIEQLEDMLTRAKAGEVIAILVVTGNSDGSSGRWIAGRPISTKSMIGDIEVLKHHAVQSLIQATS